MDFQGILKDLVGRIEGSVAATIMAVDGIAVQNFVKEGAECDLDALGVEYGKVMLEIRKATEILSLGDLEEIVITSHGLKVIIRIISQEYFLAFVLLPDGNLGKAKYYMKRTSAEAAVALAS